MGQKGVDASIFCTIQCRIFSTTVEILGKNPSVGGAV